MGVVGCSGMSQSSRIRTVPCILASVPFGEDLLGLLLLQHFVGDGLEEEAFLALPLRSALLNVDLHLSMGNE